MNEPIINKIPKQDTIEFLNLVKDFDLVELKDVNTEDIVNYFKTYN